MKQQTTISDQTLSSKQPSLKQLGWNNFFQQQLDADQAWVPARVMRQDLGRYQLINERTVLTGILPGRTRIETESEADLPTVGDWVLVSSASDNESGQVIIQRTLQRWSKFSRKKAGDKFVEQVVAANIDTVFIVTGLDDNFNPGRIERYLLLSWNSGATPVIVLNKADICDDLEEKLEQVDAVAMGTSVHAVSALTNSGIDKLRAYIPEGATAAVLGSSGVGKSTIINQMLGYEHFATGEVRQGDSKGRHTTSRRELCLIEGGGLLIDTPGMREIQFWADEGALATSFEEVELIASQCRFSDCGHESEPDCAIRAALKDETISQQRLDSYFKFQRELVHFAARADASLRLKKRNSRKKFARSGRNRPTKRD